MILGVDEKRDIVQYVEERRNRQKKKENQVIQKEEKQQDAVLEKENNKKENINNIKIGVSDVSQKHEFVDFGLITHTEKTRAVIKVQDGCNQFCSYCIIPYARGRSRSRRPENILKEVDEISKNGIKEVVITGIHIASYGKDFEPNTILEINQFLKENNREQSSNTDVKEKTQYRLIDLLEELQKLPNIQRIRLGSLEPTLITEEFVERLSKLDKICDQFHLSLQSGCNSTLKRMNRKYTVEQFKQGTELLRKAFPRVHLTTDVIVGFPGETQEEFTQTYEFLKNIKFYKMHIFKYSPRKGTIAASMKEQVDGAITEERSQKLIQLSDENERSYNQEYMGKQVEVLLENEENGYIKGHTTNYIVVKIKKNQQLKENTIHKVKITALDGIELIGEENIT